MNKQKTSINIFTILSLIIILIPIFNFEKYKYELENYGGDFYCHKEVLKQLKNSSYHIQEKITIVQPTKTTTRTCSLNLKYYPRLFHKSISHFINEDLSNYSNVFTITMITLFIINRFLFFIVTKKFSQKTQFFIMILLFVIPEFLQIYLFIFWNLNLNTRMWNLYSIESLVSYSGMLPSFISLILLELSILFFPFFLISLPISFFLSRSSRILITGFVSFQLFKINPKLSVVISAFLFILFNNFISTAVKLIFETNFRAICTLFWVSTFLLFSIK